MSSPPRPFSIFEIVFGTVVFITLLCGGFAASTFFWSDGPLSNAQRDVLEAALEGFKFGLAAILGLLGGRALSRDDMHR